MIDNKNTMKELENALHESLKTQIHKEIDYSKLIMEPTIVTATEQVKEDFNRVYGAKFDTSILENAVFCTCKKPEEPKAEEPEKWIWVEGYKGMDKNMQGHGNYQFEVGKRYDMPTDVEIKDCHSGFHLSLNLKDVFKHFRIGHGNRFFKVKALVREKDYDEYGTRVYHGFYGASVRDKLASQSIEIIRELTPEEIFKDTEWASWSEEYKKLALATTTNKVMTMVLVDELVELGYSRGFATYIVNKGRCEIAKAVASQPDLSMDMKALMILTW